MNFKIGTIFNYEDDEQGGWGVVVAKETAVTVSNNVIRGDREITRGAIPANAEPSGFKGCPSETKLAIKGALLALNLQLPPG